MVTSEATNLLMRHPRLMKWVGITLGLLFLALALVLWLDSRNGPTEPVAMDLSEALARVQAEERPWVALTDLRWMCAETPGQGLIQWASGGDVYTYALFTDARGDPLGVAFFSGARDCAALLDARWSQGVLSPLTAQDIERYAERGLVYPPGSEDTLALELCSYCGDGNTATGIYVCLALAIAMLALWPVGNHLIRQEAGENRSARFP